MRLRHYQSVKRASVKNFQTFGLSPSRWVGGGKERGSLDALSTVKAPDKNAQHVNEGGMLLPLGIFRVWERY